MARTEVRKECPSCGLGVPLEAKVCEFCGWDFEEEDEWISQIEKLEQELITEKQKFDDTTVDKLIQSSLHTTTLARPKAEEPPPEPVPTVVKTKKVPGKGSAVQVKIARPLGEELPTAEEKIAEEEERAPLPAPTASKRKSVSIKVGVAKIPPPPEEYDLEKELEAEIERQMSVEAEIERQITLDEKEKGKVAGAAKPAAAGVAPKAAPGKTRRVRRVVAHAARAADELPTAKPTAGGAIPQRPAPQETAAAKPAPSTKPKTPAAAPAKAPAPKPEPEKKGLFGKLFSGQKEEKKPEAKPAPSKKAAPAPKAAAAQKSPPSKEQKPAAPSVPAKPQLRMFQCPLCNTMVREDDKTCPNCGAEFE